jgi:hypothetical protein
MADHVVRDDPFNFVYTGGRAPPFDVWNAIIDESVDKIDNHAFYNNAHLKSVVCHDGVLKVGKVAFYTCRSLQRVEMPGVKIIEEYAVDAGSGTRYYGAFEGCTSLQRVKLPNVKVIGRCAFLNSGVQDAEFGEDLETIGTGAFCMSKLRRIIIPLKVEMFQFHDDIGAYTQFRGCSNLATVDLAGGIHKTVASLHLNSWRNEMNEKIQKINQVLPSTDPDDKTNVIMQWMQSVIGKIDHYKAEHRAILREAAILLELALWKAKFDDFIEEGDVGVGPVEENTVKNAKIDVGEARKEARITSGADIVIKNVLPFLMMVE